MRARVTACPALSSVCETPGCDSRGRDPIVNIPPETFLRVPADALRDLAVRLGLAAGLPPARADLLADLLSENDLRGVVSHGPVSWRPTYGCCATAP